MSNCQNPTMANALLEKLKRSGAYVPRKVQKRLEKAKSWGFLEAMTPAKLINPMAEEGLTLGQAIWVLNNLPAR